MFNQLVLRAAERERLFFERVDSRSTTIPNVLLLPPTHAVRKKGAPYFIEFGNTPRGTPPLSIHFIKIKKQHQRALC